ncbi:MAG: hypothetical protein R6V35_01510 [Candidatus Nanohaloarchaea archaeon]
MAGVDKAWVYDRLTREGMLPSGVEEAERMLDAEPDNDYDGVLQRAHELFRIDRNAESSGAAEFIAETSYLLREAGSRAAESDTYEAEQWREEINEYIRDYFDSGDIMDVQYPPRDEEFIDETESLMTRLKNSHFMDDGTEERTLEYLKQNFLENGI